MPSLKEAITAVVSLIAIAVWSGHRDLVWKTIAKTRVAAIKESRKPWGCPSIFDRNACTRWTK